MAKKKVVKEVDVKELNKLLGDFLFEEPETLEDGTIKTPRYETGIINLDLLLNGGLPMGKAIAIGTEPGVGKTTLLIQACGNIVEKYGKKVYYLDAEGGASYELVEAMGYANLLYHPKKNPEGKFYLLNTKTIQSIAKIIKKVCEDPETAVIVIDSDTAVTDELVLESEVLGTDKNDVGTNARMWSKVSRPLNATIGASNACLVVVHQARVNLSDFFVKIEAAGGNALKHLVSAEIWGTKSGYIGKGNAHKSSGGKPVKEEEAIGCLVKLTTKKNRLTKPFAKVSLPIFFGRGASNIWAYRDWLRDNNVVDPATGEVTPVLNKVGAGYYTLTLPSGVYKVRGDDDMWKLIDEHLDEITKYVKKNGGFTFDTSEDEDTEE
jgi:RecA/RadA recombinase